MAAAIYNKLTDSDDADSAGTYTGAEDEPEGELLADVFPTPDFFEIMEKNGMNVRNNRSRRLHPSMLDAYATIVSMAEEPYIPSFLKENQNVIWWNIGNPTFVDKKVAEETYDTINGLVEELIANNQSSK
jgi:protein-tyrosine-phosphatase